VETKGGFQVRSVFILDQKTKKLWNRVLEMVKVEWTWYSPKDATWECEDTMRTKYPHLFEDF
jgi:hypothetical protein